jgi:surfeit locus 1 family protein
VPSTRFEFRPKLLPTVAAVAGVLSTAFLGNWQLHRAAYKLELQQRVELASHRSPVQVPASLVPTEDLAFYRVEAHGEFRPELSIFLDNKVHEGTVGYEVLTPLKLANSEMHVLVDRGWVVAAATRSETPVVRTPGGEVQIDGVAVPPPTRFLELSSQVVTGRVWQNLHLDRYEQQYKIALQPVVVQQRNDLDDGLVRDWKPLDTGVDKHRAYALQWFVMSAVIIILYVVLNVRRKETPHGEI